MRKLITILTFATLLLSLSATAQQPTTPEKRRAQRAEERIQRNEERQRDRQERKEQKNEKTTARRNKGALLKFDHQNYNFGDVARKGGDLVHEFTFRNEGDTPLFITQVVTSCSCLKGNFSKRPVAPHSEGVLRITYEPHKSEPGVFNKVICVYSNSADGNELLTVQGNSLDKSRNADRTSKKRKD